MRRISRREFLVLSAGAVAGAALVACQPKTEVVSETPVVQEKEATPAVGVEKETEAAAHQAPEFLEQEKAGTLPPLAERLPLKPLVVNPMNEVGEYGGTLHTVTIRAEGYGDDTILMGCDGLLITTPEIKGLPPAGCAPNIADNWEFAEEGKVFTLHLREGIRWSDGEPFTADDIMFWWEQHMLNAEITPNISWLWKPGGEVVQVEKIDDFTVRFTGKAPMPLIVLFGGPIRGDTARSLPKHFMMKYHPDFTDKAEIMKEAEAKGYDAWYKLYNYVRGTIWGTQLRADTPNIGAYLITELSSSRRTYTRNPYYWKVDSEGNQLPYFKDVIATIVANQELVNAQIVAGQLDIVIFEPQMMNYTLYQDNAEKGQYKVTIWHSVLGSDVIYQPAQTYTGDLVLRDIFRDVRFRQALSLAINREEINEVIYHGLGTPTQWTAHPLCSFYKEEYANAYAEFDQDKANALLDEMGLKWDADKKTRLRPDGKPLGWTIEYYPVETPKTAITEMVVDMWREIGCDVQSKEITGELDTQRYTGNLVEFGLWHGDKVTDVLFAVSPQFLVAFNVGWETCWGTEWARWHLTSGKEGEEPPEEIKKVQDAWVKLTSAFEESEARELGDIILKSQAENLWCIGTVGNAPHAVIVKNNVGNFPEEAYHGWDVVWSNYHHPQQFYFKGGKSLIG